MGHITTHSLHEDTGLEHSLKRTHLLFEPGPEMFSVTGANTNV